MGLCESYSYILEVDDVGLGLADEDDILQYLLSLGWRTQNSYLYILSLALTGEKRGGWPFFDDDLLCLSSKAFSIRPT